MLLTSIFTPFEWSVLTFLIGLSITVFKFFVWVITKIELLDNDSKENRKEIEALKTEERANYKEICQRLDNICQAIVRVEEKTSHIEKQLDKR